MKKLLFLFVNHSKALIVLICLFVILGVLIRFIIVPYLNIPMYGGKHTIIKYTSIEEKHRDIRETSTVIALSSELRTNPYNKNGYQFLVTSYDCINYSPVFFISKDFYKEFKKATKKYPINLRGADYIDMLEDKLINSCLINWGYNEPSENECEWNENLQSCRLDKW